MGVMEYLFKDMRRWISISHATHHDLTSTWRCCMSDYRAVAVMQYKQLPYVVIYCPCMDIMCAVSCVYVCCAMTYGAGVLCHAVLCCAVLCCAVLCCVVL